MKAYRALPRFRPGEPFRPWLLRIVANEAHNTRRGRRRALAALQRVPVDVPGDDPAEQAMTSARRRELLEGMARLRATDREVLACRYLLSFSEAETAAVLDIPHGTVKSRSARALDRLRSILTDVVEARDG